MGFPGANAGRSEAEYVIVGVPLDISTTFYPVTRFGPDRIRRYAKAFDDYDRRTNLAFSDLAVHDAGNVRAWDDAEDYLEYLEGTLRDVARDGGLPLILGGEHTVSVAGVRAADPSVYVCLDAHLDLRDEYDGNPWSHAATTRRIIDSVDEVVLLGARTGSEAEWERAARDDVTVVEPAAIDEWTPGFTGPAYLSVDIDVADPSVAPGTGTMEPFGLSARDIRDVVQSVAPFAVGFDVVEVNDRDDGQAAALAGKLLRSFVYSHSASVRD